VRRVAYLLAGGALAAGAIAAGVVLGSRDPEASKARSVAEPPPPVARAPRLERLTELAARVPPGTRVALRRRPEGRALVEIGARTEFGSVQTLAVAFRQGDWIAVRSPALANNEVGWVRAGQLRLLRRPAALEVDLSMRELSVRDEQGHERRISVAVGAPDTPTPPGEFYVTDKLRGSEFGAYYGCCILALSGRQPNLPQGWSGGDRLAIHGSPTPTWGKAVSNGCLHADEADLRYLMRQVPLGTVVEIHA
jgi:hypothetical protein